MVLNMFFILAPPQHARPFPGLNSVKRKGRGMSLSYASRLTQGVDYGECGVAEHVDTERVRGREMGKLVKLFREARYIVIHTGAGISTCKWSTSAVLEGLTKLQRVVFATFVALTAYGRARSKALG